MVVTIDGVAGAGKSTVARMVAKQLGFKFLSTGMLYRAAAYQFDKLGLKVINEKSIKKLLANFKLNVDFVNDQQVIIVNGEDVTDSLRTERISELSALLSPYENLREIIKQIQLKISNKYNIIVDGRDTGTVVFPNAEHKFFLTADAKVRAERRLVEIRRLGDNTTTLESVLAEINERDYIDVTRKVSPLVKASDAIEIDTTSYTADEVASIIEKAVKNK